VKEGYYSTDPHLDVGAGYGGVEICPMGTYCIGGVKHLCPAGRFGEIKRQINESCSGECFPGWFCPAGSISATQKPCGDTALYCPAGSGSPVHVTRGYYSVGAVADSGAIIDDDLYKLNRVAEEICPPGSYCESDGMRYIMRKYDCLFLDLLCLFSGVRRLCPPGRYGSSSGLASVGCSGSCAAGYYCPLGSTSETEVQCGSPAVFCPGGTGSPLPVAFGYYTVGSGLATMHAERECEPGSFCVKGVKRLCAFGHYGDRWGHNSSSCAGLCSAGHYCPEGSISPTEVQCGDANKFCPGLGNFKPTMVDLGYFSTGDESLQLRALV
jgi:hypothetical protein